MPAKIWKTVQHPNINHAFPLIMMHEYQSLLKNNVLYLLKMLITETTAKKKHKGTFFF